MLTVKQQIQQTGENIASAQKQSLVRIEEGEMGQQLPQIVKYQTTDSAPQPQRNLSQQMKDKSFLDKQQNSGQGHVQDFGFQQPSIKTTPLKSGGGSKGNSIA